MFEDALGAWERLESGQATALTEARLSTHWAAQAVAAAGAALASPREDDSHTSMTWDTPTRSLRGQPLESGQRVGLKIVEFELVVTDTEGSITDTQPLEGLALERALLWLSKTLHERGANPRAVPLVRPEYALPAYPAAQGVPFASAALAARTALATWYANAARLCSALAAGTLGASPPRCWPHHFDLATRIVLDDSSVGAESARSIGCGMSPGDDTFDEPYFYCNPWPVPAEPRFPPLRGDGQWHRTGWTGAVLPASRLRADSSEQAGQVYEFLASAMAANRALLGAL